jgi:hypothetical protein
VQKQDKAAGALDERPDRGPASLADDEITLPMARNRTVLDLSGTLR